MPIGEIGHRTGLSRNTVKKYLGEGIVEPKFKTPSRLNQNIEDVVIGIDRAPKQMLPALDRYDDLVEVSFVGWARPLPADLGCKLNAKACHPVSDETVIPREAIRFSTLRRLMAKQ